MPRIAFTRRMVAGSIVSPIYLGLAGTAIKQAGALDPKRRIESLHKIKYRGLTGPISFDSQGNLNSPTHTIFEVTRGK